MSLPSVPYSPRNGEIWDQRLWGVTPTHYDPRSQQDYATKDGRWFQMNWSSPNGKYIGGEVTNIEVINRLVQKS